ncbi:MAG TPA: hypothetical protein VFT84_11910, partial [Gemmatimonadales bacterium]|nr:hypothetical protein [Gemmatimonadales bacterium]
EWQGPVERFMIDGVTMHEPFQGHRAAEIEGRWAAGAPERLEAGWFLVDTDQPLGTFAGYLLEPESEDGVVTWNVVEPAPAPHSTYPIARSRLPVMAAGEPLP